MPRVFACHFTMLVILSLLVSLAVASTHPRHHIKISHATTLSSAPEVHAANYSTLHSHRLFGSLRARGDSDDEPDELDRYGPEWSQATCLFCPSTDTLKRSGEDLVRELSTPTLMSYARADQKEFQDKCVFYTAHKDRLVNPKKKLSAGAAKWACSQGKYSIWVRSFTLQPTATPINMLQMLYSTCGQMLERKQTTQYGIKTSTAYSKPTAGFIPSMR